jgi:hypothetical protein
MSKYIPRIRPASDFCIGPRLSLLSRFLAWWYHPTIEAMQVQMLLRVWSRWKSQRGKFHTLHGMNREFDRVARLWHSKRQVKTIITYESGARFARFDFGVDIPITANVKLGDWI